MTDWLLTQFGKQKDVAERAYREFVAEGGAGPSPWERLVGGILLGGEEFVARCRALVETRSPLADIPRSEKYAGRPALDRLFAHVPAGHRAARNAHISRAYLEYGYTMKEISDFLGLHYTTVSVIIREAERETL